MTDSSSPQIRFKARFEEADDEVVEWWSNSPVIPRIGEVIHLSLIANHPAPGGWTGIVRSVEYWPGGVQDVDYVGSVSTALEVILKIGRLDESAKYVLEIYEPGSVDDVWITLSSDTPFMSIHAGDVINPGIWPGSESPMKVLRAVTVEHILWESNGITKHKICVFSDEVEGSRELRRGD